jgi:tellurite resistance protein TerC
MGAEAAGSYWAGFLTEKALSLDNVFVIAVLLGSFALPPALRARALTFGIVGALVLRTVLIVAGVTLLELFHPMLYVFGALLVVTGVRLGLAHGTPEPPRLARRLVPGATPLIAALGAIAVADVIFAVDSVPAILAITTDTFIVFAANAFALLGLRALFFLVAGAVARFAYLQLGLGVLLIGIAGKLAYGEATGEKVATSLTLGSIVAVLAVAIGASVLKERRASPPQPLPEVN